MAHLTTRSVAIGHTTDESHFLGDVTRTTIRHIRVPFFGNPLESEHVGDDPRRPLPLYSKELAYFLVGRVSSNLRLMRKNSSGFLWSVMAISVFATFSAEAMSRPKPVPKTYPDLVAVDLVNDPSGIGVLVKNQDQSGYGHYTAHLTLDDGTTVGDVNGDVPAPGLSFATTRIDPYYFGCSPKIGIPYDIPVNVQIDSTNAIEESNENNNQSRFIYHCNENLAPSCTCDAGFKPSPDHSECVSETIVEPTRSLDPAPIQKGSDRPEYLDDPTAYIGDARGDQYAPYNFYKYEYTGFPGWWNIGFGQTFPFDPTDPFANHVLPMDINEYGCLCGSDAR